MKSVLFATVIAFGAISAFAPAQAQSRRPIKAPTAQQNPCPEPMVFIPEKRMCFTNLPKPVIDRSTMRSRCKPGHVRWVKRRVNGRIIHVRQVCRYISAEDRGRISAPGPRRAERYGRTVPVRNRY